MKTEKVHTLVLGGGPAGLTTAYRLAKEGIKPIVLEKDKVVGGLMRSVWRGDFVVDIGRKELYHRIPEVDHFWSEILGRDYRPYPHRVGILYGGHILEMCPSYRGFRRGMPWSMLLGCSIDFLSCRAKDIVSEPRNMEEYWYHARGRLFTQILSQGFQEKFGGKKWADMALPENDGKGIDRSFFQTVKEAMVRTFSQDESSSYWRHPAKGTGQICEFLEREIVRAGGRIEFEARVVEMALSQGRIRAVTAEISSERVTYRPVNVVSSIQLEYLGQLLSLHRFNGGSDGHRATNSLSKSVVLAYLFLDEEPRFPHAWLKVTCPKMKAGRITNYAAFNGDMVPKGKTCLCVEYFCVRGDALLEFDTEKLGELALQECTRFRLVHPAKCFDQLVLKLPGADAAANSEDWLTETRLRLLAKLKQFENLYYVNRAGTDIATYAGIEAAEAILSSDRTAFDQRTDPTRPVVSTEVKPFTFSIPKGAVVTRGCRP